jgi:hypothetical protein
MTDTASGPMPKIIRLHTKAYKDGNTLLWLRDQDISATKLWKRWSGIVTSVADYVKWKQHGTISFVILTSLQESDFSIFSDINKQSTVFFLTHDVLNVIPGSVWKSEGFRFMLLEDMYSTYPYLMHPWDTTVEDGVACIATVFMYRHIANWNGSELRKSSLTVNNVRWTADPNCVPPSICIMTQYFVHSNAKRAREIRKCLMNNCVNPYVDKIIMLTEKDLSAEWSSLRGRDKIEQHIIGTRLTYADLLRATVDFVLPNTIVAYTNADIYLDESIVHVYGLDMRDKMLALLRWDTDERGSEPTIFGPYCDSQDTWIVLSDSVKSRTIDYERFNYQLGRAGCDNRFTADMFANRFLILNPANTIKTLHIHKSDVRDYNKTDIIKSPYYIYPYTTMIYDTNNISTYNAVIDKGARQSYDIRIRCPNPTNGVTWCTMLARHERFVWEHNIPKTITQSAPVYEWSHAMASTSGIVFTTRDTYVGQNLESFAKGATMPLTIEPATPKTHVPLFYVVPIKDITVFNHVDKYIVYYLSKLYHIGASTAMQGYYLLPEHVHNVVETFRCGRTAIYASPNTSVFADKMIGYMPNTYEINRDDIQAIRANWSEWNGGAIREKTCAVLVNRTDDDRLSPFTDAIVDGLRSRLDGWDIEVIDMNETGVDAYRKLLGKSMCIFFGGEKLDTVWPKLWALPPRCRVIEFQNELKIHGEFQQMAAAADFDSWIITLYKGSGEDMRQQALGKFDEFVRSEGLPVSA